MPRWPSSTWPDEQLDRPAVLADRGARPRRARRRTRARARLRSIGRRSGRPLVSTRGDALADRGAAAACAPPSRPRAAQACDRRVVSRGELVDRERLAAPLPSMLVAASARSTAPSSNAAESALRSVLRRWPNAACTTREKRSSLDAERRRGAARCAAPPSRRAAPARSRRRARGRRASARPTAAPSPTARRTPFRPAARRCDRPSPFAASPRCAPAAPRVSSRRNKMGDAI